MKKKFAKFLGVGLALVLALSLCLVMAVPATAADPIRLNLITVGVDSSAEWVDAETMVPQAPHTGDYSLKLYALEGHAGGAGVYIPVNVAIKDIGSLSFARLGTMGNKDAKVNLLIDADNDGDLDFTAIEALEYHRTLLDNPFGDDAMLYLNPMGLIASDDWTTVDVYNTYKYWGADKTTITPLDTLNWTNNRPFGVSGGVREVGSGVIDPTDKVLGVIVLLGAGSGVVDQTVYIDDIKVNGITYDLEASGALGMTALFAPTIGISVNPTFVDFGAVAPTVASGTQIVTVTNEGNVNADFAASIINESVAGVYTTGLSIAGGAVSAWDPTGVGASASVEPVLILTVPEGTAPGNYNAVLVFWATASQ